jgi:hypothetical protein
MMSPFKQGLKQMPSGLTFTGLVLKVSNFLSWVAIRRLSSSFVVGRQICLHVEEREIMCELFKKFREKCRVIFTILYTFIQGRSFIVLIKLYT